MNGLWMMIAAAGLMMASGFPAAFGSRCSPRGQRLAVALMILGSLSGLAGLAAVLFSDAPRVLSLPWHLPWGPVTAGVDALSAVFLVPVLTVPAVGAVFGLEYWRQSEHPDNGRGLSLFYGLLAGAMVMVVLARDSLLLLISWELMALSAFFLVTTENESADVRRAGWIYLVATHTGTVCLLGLFALLRKVTGSFALETVAAGSLTPGIAAALFFLSLAGFGFKAGIMPLHLWLPGAHANAPSHVSAVMSGVMLKMGVYGIVRMLMLLPATERWNGELLLGLGAITGVLGIAFAIGQRDIKRLLAYSSIENIGIITMGIGLALTGRVLSRPDLVLLGLGGALLHVWNHSLFKSLLFLNAGTILHATHTRDMNRMGGLARSMPRTSVLFLLGAVAICGLPPLNGFMSEWLIYLGFFHGVDAAPGGMTWPVASTGAAALALIGALSLACFVRIFSMVFLGLPRQELLPPAHDPSPWMARPMLLLAAGCVLLGLLPRLGLGLIGRATSQWAGPLEMPASALSPVLAPFQWVSGLALALILVAGAGVCLLRARVRRQDAPAIGTWSCGYARPSSTMQYTSASFGEMLVNLLAWALRPRTRRPVIATPFPPPSAFSTEVPDLLLDRIALPVFQFAGRQMMKLRLLQQGRLSIYLLYILVMTLFLLSWVRLGIGR